MAAWCSRRPSCPITGSRPRTLPGAARGVSLDARRVEAPIVLAAAASNAAATAGWITARHPTADVLLVCTDTSTDEDRACADHLAALLTNEKAHVDSIRNRILAAGSDHETHWRRHRDDVELADFRADVARCAEVDRHAIAMVGRRDGSIVDLRPVAV